MAHTRNNKNGRLYETNDIDFFNLFVRLQCRQCTINHLNEDSYNTGTVKFKNDTLGLCIGRGSAILKSTDTGETWNTQQLNIDVNIEDFQFIGDSAIFAIGDHYTVNGENMTSKLIKSENLGENWDSISILTGKQLHSIWFFNNDLGIVAGYDGIYRTVDKGSSRNTV